LSSYECPERLRLVDEYGRSISDYSVRVEALKQTPDKRSGEDRKAAQTFLALSQRAWDALEQHIAEHQCLDLHWSSDDTAGAAEFSPILAKAAAAALDVILVADDERRFVDVNEAATGVLGLPRSEVVGRRVDEFFSEPGGEAIPAAWDKFVSEGVRFGICELIAPGRRRRFEYRAKANFAPGLHLSVLRELPEAGDH
jgi:PAS domain-containing protein